jgi:hypothetical protein
LPYYKDGTGGFIGGADGSWTADPSGHVTPNPAWALVPGDSYDWALRIWVPVGARYQSPDGSSYAYLEQDKSQQRNYRLHVVDASSGTDHMVYTGSQDVPLAWGPDGIYLATSPGEGLGHPLTVVDPTTGSARDLAGTYGFEVLAGKYAWTDYGAPFPPTLIREDLTNGSTETWIDVTNHGGIHFLGQDSSGHPIVQVFPAPYQPDAPVPMYLYTAPGQSFEIAAAITFEFGSRWITDEHGLWLQGTDGTYLLDSHDQLQRVSTVTGGQIAGICR